MKLRSLFLSLSIIVLSTMIMAASCGTQSISGNPAADAQKAATSLQNDVVAKKIVEGIQNASWNFDQALLVGALKKDDPAPPCFHALMLDLGIDPASPPPPGSSFTPRVTDVISFGSVLYIRAQQAQDVQGAGIKVPPSCDALVSLVIKDALRTGIKSQMGGGNLFLFR